MNKRISVFLFMILMIISNCFLCAETRECLGFEKEDPAKMQQLVENSYYGAYRLGYGAGTYLDYNFF